MTNRIYSEVTDYGRGRRIAIVRDVDGDRLEVMQAMTVKVIDRYTVVGDSDWTLSDLTLGRQRVDQILQALLDHAWELGMRPKGFSDTTEQVAALRDHLGDMRALVFKNYLKPKGAAP